MATTLVRPYEVSDNDMLKSANIFADELKNNYFAHFSALNPLVFDVEFLPGFTIAIANAEKVPTDEQLRDKQALETEDVTDIRQKCLFEVGLAKYYISEAFGKRERVMDIFGYDNVSSIRTNTEKVISFMELFIAELTKVMDQLTPMGYPASKPELLQSLLNQLRTERSEQHEAINDRLRMTDFRIQTMSSVWEVMSVISRAKEFALAEDKTAQEIFTLPRPAEANAPLSGN